MFELHNLSSIVPVNAILLTLIISACGTVNITGDGQSDPVTNWDPPIDNISDELWRDSDEYWCSGNSAAWAFKVWSNDIAIFALTSSLSTISTDELINTIKTNDGSGWDDYISASVYSHSNCFDDISGDDNGNIYLWSNYDISCHMSYVEWGSDMLQTTGMRIRDLFVVEPNLVYAISEEVDGQRLLEYNGIEWSPVPIAVPPYHISKIWASTSAIWGVGDLGTILIYDFVTWNIHEAGTVDDLNTVYGLNDGTIFIGSKTGRLFIYNGYSFSEAPWDELADCGTECQIVQIWGTEDIVYFATNHQLVSYSGGDFNIISEWPCAEATDCLNIYDLWGNSTTEIFLAVYDPNHARTDCGNMYLLWFDGVNYHWI